MSEQAPSTEQDTPAATPGETGPASAEPRSAGETAGQTTPRHGPVTSAVARMSIMQLLLVLVLALFLWQWFDTHQQLNDMQQQLARRLSEMEGNNKASQLLVTQGQEATRELGAKVALLEAHYADMESQRTALESLYQSLSSSRDETTLAQVEQMLLIAGQQLQLAGNVKAALIAMQQADDYLKRMNRPALDGLRKTIGSDMDKLRKLPTVDTPGINLRLDDLIAAVDGLPLAQDIRMQQEAAAAPAAPAGTGWQGLVREMWDDAKQLVRIENTDRQELPLISPTQTFFLRENLKLRFLSARLALLTHDEASYKRDLQTAQNWIKRFFNVKSPEAAQALDSLKALRASSISINLPDISASLAAVRNYRLSHEKAAQ